MIVKKKMAIFKFSVIIPSSLWIYPAYYFLTLFRLLFNLLCTLIGYLYVLVLCYIFLDVKDSVLNDYFHMVSEIMPYSNNKPYLTIHSIIIDYLLYARYCAAH